MTRHSRTPPAAGTANGVKIKADEASMKRYPNRVAPATLSRLRSAHLARIRGASEERAALIASVYFAGCRS